MNMFKIHSSMRYLLALLITLQIIPAMSYAQSEAGLMLSAEAEKKLSRKLSIGLEADLRTRNNLKTIDRWGFGLGASYKLTNWLKVDGGYKLLDYNMREKISYKSSGAYNHWRPSYYGIKHRIYLGLTGSYKFSNNIKLSLRERWQYTYRPEKTTTRWDFDDEQWEDKVRSGKGKNQLRSRFEISYDKKRALLTPYASVELYNSWNIEKVRYTLGTDINLTKQHVFSVYYRFQKIHDRDDEDYDPDMHFIGAGYKFKF